MADQKEYMLSPYRVLDLSDERGLMCGKLLGDMGADVIKIEPPGGSPARDIGPFYKDTPHREKSLFWFAFNTSKRGITLDITKPTGKELFLRLVKTTDVVVESFEPGYMASLGLGYDDLCQVKPDIIMTSITPFGQTGPYAHYKASDLTLQGLGGLQYLIGDDDRAPVRPGQDTIAVQAGAEGAAGAAFALFHRGNTGEGQHVDVSMQLVSIWQLMNASPYPKLHGGDNQTRQGRFSKYGFARQRAVHQVKDGYLMALFLGGPAYVVSETALVRWIDEEGGAPQWIKEWPWATWDMAKIMTDPEAQKDVDRVEGTFSSFLATKTKAELWERAFRDRILLAPSNNVKDVREQPQLNARGYFPQLEHPELGDSLTYVGHISRYNNARQGPRFRAPLIGEHNQEVYVKELGLSQQDTVALKQAGVI